MCIRDRLNAEDDVVKLGVPIVFDGITFATGKADITPESENTLQKALKTLKTYQDISVAVSYTHLRAHETVLDLVCRLLLEKTHQKSTYN